MSPKGGNEGGREGGRECKRFEPKKLSPLRIPNESREVLKHDNLVVKFEASDQHCHEHAQTNEFQTTDGAVTAILCKPAD